MEEPTSDANLFKDEFTVTAVNSAKYDRVSRISGHNMARDVEFTLDVNTEVYEMQPNDKIELVLASTLSLDGSKDDGKGWRDTQRGETTLADMYDYVCHGKVYRFEDGEGENIKAFISFGGLLLYMVGSIQRLTPLKIDHVYLLIKR